MRAVKIVLLLALLVSLAAAQSPAQSVAGRWQATISPQNKAGEKLFDTHFVFVIASGAKGLQATLYNGPERMEFSSAEFSSGRLTLRLSQYDGAISAKLGENGTLSGDYTRQTSTGIRHYPLTAVKSAASKGDVKAANSLAGDWVVTFINDSGSDKVAPAVFHVEKDGSVNGTIAPVSGDYGLLSGTVTPGQHPKFSLSRFDGIHVLLLEGEIDSANAMHGALNKSDDFTAVRKGSSDSANSAEAPPDPEAVSKLKDPNEVFRYTGANPQSGKAVTQDDFKGKAVIVDIFGTWCPNCHDEAPLLADLYKRYHAQGLEIVGLAYEYTDDATRNARMVEIYRKKYGIEFPLLISGTTGGKDIAKTLPQLEGFGGYPTTIFIGRDGKVRHIHAGFAGPATGKLEEVKKRFDQNTEEILGNRK